MPEECVTIPMFKTTPVLACSSCTYLGLYMRIFHNIGTRYFSDDLYVKLRGCSMILIHNKSYLDVDVFWLAIRYTREKRTCNLMVCADDERLREVKTKYGMEKILEIVMWMLKIYVDSVLGFRSVKKGVKQQARDYLRQLEVRVIEDYFARLG